MTLSISAVSPSADRAPAGALAPVDARFPLPPTPPASRPDAAALAALVRARRLKAAPPGHTVAEMLALYEREYLPGLAKETQRTARPLYRRWRRAFGERLVTDLTPAYLREWRDSLSVRYAPATVNRYLASLAAPLAAVQRDYEWISVNPVHKVRKMGEPSGRVRFLDDEERHRLLKACQVSHNPHLFTLVLLALTTGARRNEMLQLRWDAVDLERGLLQLTQTKNKERRAVPVRGEALDLLRRQHHEHPQEAWVFARWDAQGPTHFEQAWQTAKRRAELVNFHFHDLRHTAASYLAMSGATLHEIATILGHKTLKMTMRYAHLTTGHTGAIIERMVKHKLGTQEESLYGRTDR
jgi:integrase